MLYLYLDESGDLGFDFVNKKPSNYFTICVLAIKGADKNRSLGNAVKAVLQRKFPKRTGEVQELKGNTLPLEIKRYFYRHARVIDFQLCAATLSKRAICGRLSVEKDRIYSYLARLALEKVNFDDAAIRVIMTVDKRGPDRETVRFNNYILSQIKGMIDPLVPLDIFHVPSQESYGLQAADLFAWGVQRKYEMRDRAWYEVFKEKIRTERLY